MHHCLLRGGGGSFSCKSSIMMFEFLIVITFPIDWILYLRTSRFNLKICISCSYTLFERSLSKERGKFQIITLFQFQDSWKSFTWLYFAKEKIKTWELLSIIIGKCCRLEFSGLLSKAVLKHSLQGRPS